MSILCKCLHIGLDNIRGQIDSKCCHKESECMNWVSFHGIGYCYDLVIVSEQ